MNPNIHVDRVIGPDTGAMIATYCEYCRTTEFRWSPYATKPKDGDFFLLNGICGNIAHGLKINYVPPPRFGAAILPGSDINPFPFSGSLKNEQG